MKEVNRSLSLLLAVGVMGCLVTEARADPLVSTEARITDSPAIDTTPTLGDDDSGNLVVYTSQEISTPGILPGVIHVQGLDASGAPVGAVITVSDGLTDDKLNDVFGSRVVFTAYESTSSAQGHIKVHDLSTETTTALFPAATFVRHARIHDDVVVWVQGAVSEAQIIYFDLNWAGTARGPQVIAGGSPAALNVEIGDRYIVWNTFNPAGTSDVLAIDRSDPALDDPTGTPAQIAVSTQPDVHEQNASTSGEWIVWEARPPASAERSTHAFNPATDETRIIQNMASSRNPSIDGDLVAYESNAGESGAFDIFLYRLPDGATFQVTNDSNDQVLNNIHGNLVAYVDNRTSPADIFVSLLEFGLIDWVTVGGPGNACDTQSEGCFGSVAEPYRISKFEVTNAQYAEFLNAVAATDTNALYNTLMGSIPDFGGITRSGSSGSFSYSTIAGREGMPVLAVSFWDATRFANWLDNGQPTGLQDNTTTEDGAYTLTPTGITNNTVTRNAGAEVFVPSEDEWYKAAYYDTGTMIYFDYPAGTDTQTTCTAPGSAANTANCGFVNTDLTDVGSYTGAASPGGTFDQGGNVWEWNEAIISGSNRGIRGGAFNGNAVNLATSLRGFAGPTLETGGVGFRVASPVPATPASPVPSLSPLAMAMLWSLLALGGWRKLRR